MHPLVNIGVRAARNAANVIVRYLDRLDTLGVTDKGRNDLVSEVDREAERVIIETIRKAYPGHAILAEETGASGEGEYCWVVDPLDGTMNYLHGFPQFAVSIGVTYRGRLDQAVVFDPLRQELFTASRGSGAQLDGRRMRVSTRGLKSALVGTGFPLRELERLDTYIATFREVVKRSAGVRRAGSAALDLAYVAAGRLDGFWEFGLSPWDIAAGALLIQEAGGIVQDPGGGDRFMESGDVVAGNPKALGELLEAIAPHLPGARRQGGAGTRPIC